MNADKNSQQSVSRALVSFFRPVILICVYPRSSAVVSFLHLPRLALLAFAFLLIASVAVVVSPKQATVAAPPQQQEKLDPAAWGADHVGQPIPQYMESGECLFCHRDKVGATWGKNRHNRTIREAEASEPAMAALRDNKGTAEFADQVKLLLGGPHASRFLRRAKAYGHVDMLSVAARKGRGDRARLEHADNPHWDAKSFAQSCAGCHTTAVDTKTQAFAALALDCYSCHGEGAEEHANDPSLMPLSRRRKDPPRAVTSICASCHLRFGKSKSSGLPYANNFVAGDNLFKDYQVDWALADDPEINPADRHVLANVRDVVVNGQESMTCLSCHDVHTGSSRRHRDVPEQKYCLQCHVAGKDKKQLVPYEVHSERCQY